MCGILDSRLGRCLTVGVFAIAPREYTRYDAWSSPANLVYWNSRLSVGSFCTNSHNSS